jgi:hypothetical protein
VQNFNQLSFNSLFRFKKTLLEKEDDKNSDGNRRIGYIKNRTKKYELIGAYKWHPRWIMTFKDWEV